MSYSHEQLRRDPQPHHDVFARGLGSQNSSLKVGTFTHSQNRVILIASLSCACVSLLVAVVALRWFMLMRRAFRHRLVLFLILSDTCKAIWYLVFPVVVFARGPVASSSSFCQASGFFLLLAVEASDFAILLIALHAILYIFIPTGKSGEGGLYPYRRWILPIWLGPPVLAASLAFVNEDHAYVSSGTFCYLPKRPFWYRLALSWVPRYLIISTIFLMYASIYIYVHFKFRDFGHLAAGDLSYESKSVSRYSSVSDPTATEQKPQPPVPSTVKPSHARPSAPRTHSGSSILRMSNNPVSDPEAPWESMSFITSKPLHGPAPSQTASGVAEGFVKQSIPGAAETYAPPRAMSVVIEKDELSQDSRKPSEVPTINTSLTGETVTTQTSDNTAPIRSTSVATDPLRNTRIAILRQLRFLFIYPLIYLLMWIFPFAAHALNYNDHYVAHPVFWLTVVQTVMLALQAGVDSVVFSWREKPWRRIDDNSKLSMTFLRRHSKALISRPNESSAACSNPPLVDAGSTAARPNRNAHWWEAEGRKRKDSVWMGTEILTQIASRRERNDLRTVPSQEKESV